MLTTLDKDMAIIAKLDDEPNDVGGLTAAALKAKFDEAGETVKDFLNGTLLPELAAPGAAQALGAVLDGKDTTVQGALDTLNQASIQSGNVPVGGAAGEYLRKASDELYDLEWAPPFVAFPFAEGDWVQGSDGDYAITVPQSTHRRGSAAFGCTLRQLADGAYVSSTWATLGTQSAWAEDTGEITLTSPDPYNGTAVFYG